MTAVSRAERVRQLTTARDVLVDLLDAADQSPVELPTFSARATLESVQLLLDDGWADQHDLAALIEQWRPVLGGEAGTGSPIVDRATGPIVARIADLQLQVVAVLGELAR